MQVKKPKIRQKSIYKRHLHKGVCNLKKLVKRITTEAFQDNNNLKETVVQYHYDTPEARAEHVKEMLSMGYTDSGQVNENVGSIMNPKYVYFGSYYKIERL